MKSLCVACTLALTAVLSGCAAESIDSTSGQEVETPDLETQQKTPIIECYYDYYFWCNAQQWINGQWVCTEKCEAKISQCDANDYNVYCGLSTN